MSKTILVVTKLQKNIELLLRRLESVVKPGNRIVVSFRVPARRSHLAPGPGHSGANGFDNGLTWQEQKAWLSWDEQKAQAEEIVGEPRVGHSAGSAWRLWWISIRAR